MNSTRTPRYGLPRSGADRAAQGARIARAIFRFGDAGPLAFGAASPLESTVRGFNGAERAVIAASPSLRRAFKRILLDIGERAKTRVVRRQRQLDLIQRQKDAPDGTSIHDWGVKLLSSNGQFDDRVALTNRAPYILYMHAKGTPKSHTFFNYELPPIQEAMRLELIRDTGAFKRSPAFQRALKMRLLSGVG